MKNGHFICSCYFGNTLVDLYGYDGDISYAYIDDEDITEMLYQFNAWDKVREDAAKEII